MRAAGGTEQSLQFAKYGGKVVGFGVPGEEETMSVSPYDVYRREIRLLGTFAQTHCFDRALAFLASGEVEVEPLVTHTFPLEDYARALEVLMTEREALKVIIQ